MTKIKTTAFCFWECSSVCVDFKGNLSIREQDQQTKRTNASVLTELSLDEAKKLRDELTTAITEYEELSRSVEKYFSTEEKLESEDPKPSDWMNF
jgi:hypothetical protein